MAKSQYDKIKSRFNEIVEWREEGLTIDEIADKLNIHRSTIYDYKNKYPDFSDIIETSKIKLVNNLKKTLYKEAMGYDYAEKTINNDKIKIVIKHARAQATLLIYALCNLDPDFKRLDKNIIESVIESKTVFENPRIQKAYNVLMGIEEPELEKENVFADLESEVLCDE